ncbi:MAG: Uma2 family endonuclease [Blastocatellia bacterium]
MEHTELSTRTLPETESAPAVRSGNRVNMETLLTLEHGDHLTRAEFECRYHAMPWVKKAELIEGRVYMGSPVRYQSHAEPHGIIMGLLMLYRVATPGTSSGDNGTVRLDQDNEPQPDVILRIDEACGGQSSVSGEDYVSGAPELVVEVASSTASYDLHEKKNVYRRNGVREYIVWRVLDGELDWFRLENEAYVRVAADENGVIESAVFPGLRLAVTKLLADETAAVLAELQAGLQSEAHARFVSALAARRAERETEGK